MPQSLNLELNRRSAELLKSVAVRSAELKVNVSRIGEAKLFDFGIAARGGLAAGQALAECSCGNLARVQFGQQIIGDRCRPIVQVATDQPVAACMGAQYAGWPVQYADFFAMASGPIRGLRGEEKLLQEFHLLAEEAEGVICLETSRIPPVETVQEIASQAGIAMENLYLAVAPTRSIAGSVQVVARSVETAMHKLHELGFDLNAVCSGLGTAPLPPVANDDLKGIGLTNDAILFGGQVDLWVDVDETTIDEIGPQTPSSASSDYGTPFYELFKQKEFKFYDIDPLLFSPAAICFHNLRTGSSRRFGDVNPDLLGKSFDIR